MTGTLKWVTSDMTDEKPTVIFLFHHMLELGNSQMKVYSNAACDPVSAIRHPRQRLSPVSSKFLEKIKNKIILKNGRPHIWPLRQGGRAWAPGRLCGGLLRGQNALSTFPAWSPGANKLLGWQISELPR